MDRYITLELVPPFLFGVGAFSSLGVSIGALFDLIRRVTESGLPISVAVQVLLLKMPEFIAYSFPMSILLSCLMTYSRLSSDSELVALKACGVSIYRMVLPALGLAFLVTGMTFAFNEMLVPSANYQATQTLAAALNDKDPDFQERNILYQEFESVKQPNGKKKDVLARLFYAKEFDGNQMRGLTILDFSQDGFDQIVSAKSAAWNPTQKLWDFFDGTIYAVSPDGSFRNIAKFDQQQLKLPRGPLDLASQPRDYNEMNLAQSYDYLELLKQSGDADKIRKLRVRIQQKYALPFICVAFGLVGAALGARLNRGGRSTGFAISIVIIFSYYLLAVICGSIAQLGVISPLLGAWLPNLFGLGAAALLLLRSTR
ncbi:MAG: LptF/LptG family permease [Pegethrix bostrychoides GSE-TBD4-15B]|jgi:lipopolysaccharide export system permease protein|uniref:LptF/LptG family permease n=1 Tax=Pegethrix bostrychoides GSE-TBD4-15B TaxID=2839662 RepID=A0A951PBL7_9CYAN|nr:LptF/LptG family permease [Pegethrix bostrychoides GSE-TBD4-15B]